MSSLGQSDPGTWDREDRQIRESARTTVGSDGVAQETRQPASVHPGLSGRYKPHAPSGERIRSRDGPWLIKPEPGQPREGGAGEDRTVGRLLPEGRSWHKGSVKSLTEYLWFELPRRRGFVNITETVESLVRRSGVQEGLCLVNAMHITASVFINDAEDGLLQDFDDWLEKLAPHEPISQYRHNRTGEDNADAHLKRQVMGREVVVAITKGRLDLGPWEQIFYGEFDGRRRKRVLVKILGE